MRARKVGVSLRMYALNLPRTQQVLIILAVGIGGGALIAFIASSTSPLATLVLAAGVVIAILILRSPMLGFLMTAAVIPMERIGRLTEDTSDYTISLMRIIGVMALGSLLLHAAIKKHQLRFGVAFSLYTLYWGVTVLTMFYAIDEHGGLQGSAAILGNIVFFFLVINIVNNWKTAKTAVAIWLLSSVLIGTYTIYDWHFGGSSLSDSQIGISDSRFSTVHSDNAEWAALSDVKRAIGPTSHAAVYGINLIMTLPFMLFFLRFEISKIGRYLIFSGLLIILYNIFLANTRAAIILAGLVLIYAAHRRLYHMSPKVLMIMLSVSFMILPFMPSSVYERILDPSNYSLERSSTLQIRLEYWKVGLEVAGDNFFTGIGTGDELTIPKYITKDIGGIKTSVHNDYLQTFIEVGVFGWFFYMAFILLMLSYSFKAAQVFKEGENTHEMYWFMVSIQITMLAVMIYGLQVDVFHFPLKGWWLVVGLTWVMNQIAINYLKENNTGMYKKYARIRTK